MSFQDKITSLNCFDPNNYVPFVMEGKRPGYIRKDKVDLALSFDRAMKRDGDSIIVNPELSGFDEISATFKEILPELEKNGAFAFPLKNEMFPVVMGWGEEPLFKIERNATIFFGVRIFGLHVNGYTFRNGKMHMWLGKRGPTLRGWPNMLDQMVAGGQPIGLSLFDNLLKESHEEAQLSAEIASKARAAGSITYSMNMIEGARRDTIFVYDLLLPEDVHPIPDGDEVAEFVCLPVEEVMEIVANTDSFKPNCNLVCLDFFIRHGFITADEFKGYTGLVSGLRAF